MDAVAPEPTQQQKRPLEPLPPSSELGEPPAKRAKLATEEPTTTSNPAQPQAPFQETVQPNKLAGAQATQQGGEDAVEESAGDIPPREINEVINAKYLDKANVGQIRQSYLQGVPFHHVMLPNFCNEQFLEEVVSNLNNEEWYQKRNDLYTFEQTDDLKVSQQPGLRDLRSALYSPQFREFLSTLTGVSLNATVDISGHIYKQGGQLLCHDDELEGRRIAFILYLVPKDWSKQDGGTLDLFASQNGQPTQIVNSVVPVWNSLVFFEISPTTFHQVSEVLGNKERLSISGWFHGPPLPPGKVIPEQPLPRISAGAMAQQHAGSLEQWINPEYLKRDVQRKLKNHFEKEASLALTDILLPHRYNAVHAALKSESLRWNPLGPPNKRHYDTLGRWGPETETGEILQLKVFLRSRPFIGFVENITGLSVFECYRGEVRRFKHQDYTLAQDNQEQNATEGLDLYLGFQDSIWTVEDGGFITYFDEEDELLTLVPRNNTLTLVLREQGCMQFVKFLTSSSPAPRYDYQLTYILSKDDDEGGDYANDQDEDYQSDEYVDEDEDDDNAPSRGGGGGGGNAAYRPPGGGDEYDDDDEIIDGDEDDYY